MEYHGIVEEKTHDHWNHRGMINPYQPLLGSWQFPPVEPPLCASAEAGAEAASETRPEALRDFGEDGKTGKSLWF